MMAKKNYVMPEIADEEVRRVAAELITFVEGLVCEANARQEEIQALEVELAQLREARKRDGRSPT
jgi:predicted nuclease with TOPRIM domain